MHRIGIDIGGTGAKLGLVAADGTVLRRGHVPTGRDLPADSLVAQLAEAVGALRAEEPVLGLGVAAPGMRRPDGEGVINVTNLPHIDGYPLRRRLEEATGLRTAVDNDANAAAMGEYRFGGGTGARRLMVITVGTGIGGGMVVEGEVLRVSWGGLGDPGHVVVAPGPKCLCGATGCVEALAAVPAILRRAAFNLGREGESLDLAAVIGAARSGEPGALQAFREAGEFLGMALVTLLHVLAPETILLGGGGMDAAEDLLFEPTRESFLARAQPFLIRSLTFGRARLGNDAGLVGAAALVQDPAAG